MLPLIAPGEQKSHLSLVCLFSPVKVDPGINPMIGDPGLDIRHPSLNLLPGFVPFITLYFRWIQWGGGGPHNVFFSTRRESPSTLISTPGKCD